MTRAAIGPRALVLLAAGAIWLALGGELRAQIYGYTNEKGILILSNVPNDSRMRIIAEESGPTSAPVWHYSGQYDAMIFRAAQMAGLDSNLVKAVIAVESAFNRFAVSHKGAQGLMQLMPDTARRYGAANPFDPWQNIRAGSRHLRDLLDEFGDLSLALAAYNAGATPVRRVRGIPPYRETRNYVKKVMAIYRAGGRISITRAGRTYTMGPEGKVAVHNAPGGAEPSAPVPPRTATDAAPALVAAAPALVPEAVPAAAPVETAVSEPRFYRYTDAEGVTYITRRKPSHGDYEVLPP